MPREPTCRISLLMPNSSRTQSYWMSDAVLCDTALQSIVSLRDTWHVRKCSLRAWRELLTLAGFKVVGDKNWKLPLQFDSWVARMRTPTERVAAIRSLWDSAPMEVSAY